MRVICFVLEATDGDVADASSRGVELVRLEGAEVQFVSAHKYELAERAREWPDLEWWVGHDIKSGPIAVEVAKLTHSRAAVIQHTDHISYAALKGSPGEAMIDRNLAEIDTLARAAAVFGVGPTLADAARDRVRGVGTPVTDLVPGLATIPPLPMPKPFRPITFGRLDPIADMIKQGRLAVRAFAQLLLEAPDIVGPSPRMTVVGIDPGASEEEGLRQLARERVGYDVSIVGHPFTESRERLFRVLADASARLMLSVHEGFGLAGWEAIAAEVPLVLSRASGLHRLLDERYHGGALGRVWTVHVKGGPAIEEDIAAVARQLRAIARQPDVAKDRAVALREQLAEWTWERTARTFVEGLGMPLVAGQRGKRLDDEPRAVAAPLGGDDRVDRPQPLDARGRQPAHTPSVAAEPSGTLTLPASNLPIRTDEFVEWPGEPAACATALAANRLVTLVGPPGAGKTRLAVEVARTLMHEFDDHAYFVDLTTIADPALVVNSITRALRIEAGEPVLDALKELFHGTRALLVLDNFEHLLSGTDAVQELLAEVPTLKVLATSREPLGMPLEHVADLPPLPVELAACLFASRATGRGLSKNDPQVRRLCERLDCLPLAIELVAPRARLYSLDDLLATIEASILDVNRRQRNVPERQRSLRAAIEWSYARLSDSEKRLFSELSVFAGGCTVQTAAAVLRGGPPDHVLEEDLMSLLDKRLLRDDARTRHRFLMPATLRGYASEQLRGVEAVRRRHAEHFLEFARSAKTPALEVELDNLAAALRHFVARREADEALELARLLGRFWWSRDFPEGWRRLREALELEVPPRLAKLQAEVRLTAGRLAIRLGKLDEAAEQFAVSLANARREGDGELEARALGEAALVHMERAQFDAALPLLNRALEALSAGDDRADVLDSLGVVATGTKEYETAERRLGESLAMYEDEIGAAWVHNDLARLALARDDLRVAEDHAKRAFSTGQSRSDWALIAWARNYLGFVSSRHGDLEIAREHHDESLKLVRLLGDRRPQALALEGFATLAVEEGEPTRALPLTGAADALRADAGIPRTAAESAILERRLDRALAALGTGADAALGAGRALSLDEAVALARGA